MATEAPVKAAATTNNNNNQKLVLTLACPHQTIVKAEVVERVDVPATSGDMGILANHVPTIQMLKAGVVDVMYEGGKTKKLFGVYGCSAIVSNISE